MTKICPVVCKNFAGRQFIFQQDDNAPVHRSLLTRLWKKERHISSFTWPAQSPDINVIENVWKVIKVHVQKDLSHIKSRQDLIESVLKAWSKLHRTYSSALRIHSTTYSFCYCTERFYNKILKFQVSVFIDNILFVVLEFDLQ